MRIETWYRNRYGSIPPHAIPVAQFGSTLFCAWYWARSIDELGIALVALLIATYSTAALLIGLEGARLIPAWRTSPGGT
ncbi:hypothetical protein [Candidatus Palauibacter sp.]|uniref:hypothetical protein n=1 Tax=Candidatus Palauibacter sp. TaxID=3101350 RepID=UPI003B52BE7A